MSSPHAMPETTFYALLAEYFEVHSEIVSSSQLAEDLGFDSIQMYEIVLLLEEIGGHEVPDQVLGSLATASDVYDTYVIYLGHH
jgi:acyl carrier protein